jgi:putative tricarboxylic transport membrane protein
MEILQNLFMGFETILSPIYLIYTLLGVILGAIIGALPGLGASAGIAILLPITYGMNPIAGIVMLCGIYYGGMYGGSITAITINTPGDSAAVMTAIDGYPLAKKGQAGKALGMAAFASIIGGSISVIIYTFFAPLLAKFAITFGPPEYFALMALGLTSIGGMTGDFPIKGYISAFLGLFLATIGLDSVIGLERFTFGILELYEGIDFIPAAMGLFGIAEIMILSDNDQSIIIDKKELSFRKQFPTKEDIKISMSHILRSTGLGFLIGVLPGAGATIGSFLGYSTAKKLSKRGEKFGTGVIEGVAAPESANNAASIGAMVPLITLGVPGSGATAMMLGALMMFGLRPGPQIFETNPDFVWGLVASMYIGNIFLFLIAILALPAIVKILAVKKPILNAVVLAFILIGAYCLRNSMFHVGLTVAFGILGYFLKKFKFPLTPIVLALVLGNLLERSFRQSIILFKGDLLMFFSRPISGVLLGITIIMVLLPLIIKLFNKIKRKDYKNKSIKENF